MSVVFADCTTLVQMKVADFSISSLTIEGKISGVANKIEVPVFGKQNLTNIMVAASAALALKVSPEKIWEALRKIKTNWGRNQFVTSDKGGKILFEKLKQLETADSLICAKGTRGMKTERVVQGLSQTFTSK